MRAPSEGMGQEAPRRGAPGTPRARVHPYSCARRLFHQNLAAGPAGSACICADAREVEILDFRKSMALSNGEYAPLCAQYALPVLVLHVAACQEESPAQLCDASHRETGHGSIRPKGRVPCGFDAAGSVRSSGWAGKRRRRQGRSRGVRIMRHPSQFSKRSSSHIAVAFGIRAAAERRCDNVSVPAGDGACNSRLQRSDGKRQRGTFHPAAGYPAAIGKQQGGAPGPTRERGKGAGRGLFRPGREPGKNTFHEGLPGRAVGTGKTAQALSGFRPGWRNW